MGGVGVSAEVPLVEGQGATVVAAGDRAAAGAAAIFEQVEPVSPGAPGRTLRVGSQRPPLREMERWFGQAARTVARGSSTLSASAVVPGATPEVNPPEVPLHTLQRHLRRATVRPVATVDRVRAETRPAPSPE